MRFSKARYKHKAYLGMRAGLKTLRSASHSVKVPASTGALAIPILQGAVGKANIPTLPPFVDNDLTFINFIYRNK